MNPHATIQYCQTHLVYFIASNGHVHTHYSNITNTLTHCTYSIHLFTQFKHKTNPHIHKYIHVERHYTHTHAHTNDCMSIPVITRHNTFPYLKSHDYTAHLKLYSYLCIKRLHCNHCSRHLPPQKCNYKKKNYMSRLW